MPDITSIVASVNAIKTALTIAKDLKDATAAYNDAEFRLKLSELYVNLSEARISLADAQEEIHSLEKKVKNLQEKIDTTDELEFRDGKYFRKVSLQGKPNGPFCPGCYESKKVLSSLRETEHDFAFAGKFTCNSCNTMLS